MSRLQQIDWLFRKTLVPLNSFKVKINPKEDNLVAELRDRVSKVIILRKPSDLHNQWLGHIIHLKDEILKKNPKNFLQWDIIRKTMFIGNALFTLREFVYLKNNNWNKWKEVVKDANFFPSEPYILYPKSHGNLIHYAYHIAKFEQMSGKKIKDFDFIFEFGGGYGGMCQLIYNLGFNGKYIIFDFSILSALQAFYLKMNKLKATFNIRDKKAQIYCLDNTQDIKKILPKKGRKLFLATWSLSESPLELRKKIFPLTKDMDAFLIGYQEQFGGVDNTKYYKNYSKKLSNFQWWGEEIKQLKSNHYLFGLKKEK